LRHPSKAGVLLLRVARALPALAWPGLCWAAAYAMAFGDVIGRRPVAALIVLVTIVTAPVVAALGRLARRLEGVESSTLGPLALCLVAVFCWREVAEGRNSGIELVLGILLGLLSIGSITVLARAWLRQPRVEARGLLFDLASLPRVVVAVGLLVCAARALPHRMTRPWAGETLAWLAWLAAPATAFLAVQTLRRIVTSVATAEERTGGSAIRTVQADDPVDDGEVSRRMLPVRHRGRSSLLRAQGYLHRLEWLRFPLDGPWDRLWLLPRVLFASVYHGIWPLAAMTAMWQASGREVAPLQALFAAALAPTFVGVRLRSRLYLLGIDYRRQVKHNLFAFACFAAAPTLLAAGVTAVIVGLEQRHLLVLTAMAAVLLLRSGWNGLTRRETERDMFAVAIGVLAIAASRWFPIVNWGTVVPVCVIGLLGVCLRLRRSEADLAHEVRERENP